MISAVKLAMAIIQGLLGKLNFANKHVASVGKYYYYIIRARVAFERYLITKILTISHTRVTKSILNEAGNKRLASY